MNADSISMWMTFDLILACYLLPPASVFWKTDVYSAFDIVDNIVVGNMSSEYIQFSLIEAEDKSYESTSDNVGLQEFSYAYTVISEQIKDFPEVPVTPEEDTTTEEGTSTENVENPETSDGIALFLGLTIVGFAGVALTYRRLHN